MLQAVFDSLDGTHPRKRALEERWWLWQEKRGCSKAALYPIAASMAMGRHQHLSDSSLLRMIRALQQGSTQPQDARAISQIIAATLGPAPRRLNDLKRQWQQDMGAQKLASGALQLWPWLAADGRLLALERVQGWFTAPLGFAAATLHHQAGAELSYDKQTNCITLDAMADIDGLCFRLLRLVALLWLDKQIQHFAHGQPSWQILSGRELRFLSLAQQNISQLPTALQKQDAIWCYSSRLASSASNIFFPGKLAQALQQLKTGPDDKQRPGTDLWRAIAAVRPLSQYEEMRHAAAP